MELWELVASQVRMISMNAYCIDLAAIALIFQIIGIPDIEWQMRKMQMIFSIQHEHEAK